MIDWINHMGRIVEQTFSVTSRLWREGHAYENYYRVYFVLSHISVGLYIKSETLGTRLYQAVLGCILLDQAVPGFTRLYLAVPDCILLY